jgi:hypothetical protein
MLTKKATASKPPEKKPVKPATPAVTNPSEKLALLLRKEGMAAARVTKAQQDLKAIQADIQKMWDARNAQAKALLGESAGMEG